MEDTARALGAADEGMIIAGVNCKARPLSMKELAELERLCVSQFRRNFIQTASENLDLLPDAVATDIIQRKIEEASRFDLATLPVRYSYSPDKVVITDALRLWLDTEMDALSDAEAESAEQQTQRLKNITAGVLEAGLLSEADYTSMTGDIPKKARVPYVSWWITSTFAGRMEMAWLSFSNCGVTRKQFEDALSGNPRMLVQVAQKIQALTVPSVGNG